MADELPVTGSLAPSDTEAGEPKSIQVGNEVYQIDRELSAVLSSGIPAVLTACREGRQVIKQESLFLVSADDGNVYPGTGCGMGLYASDTRFLSGLILKLEGEVPTLLSFSAERNFLSQVEYMNQKLSLPDGTEIAQETIYVSSIRAIESYLREQIRVVNYNPFPLTLQLSLEFAADYADIFEVRGMHRQRHGTFLQPKVEGEHGLMLSYMGGDELFRQTRIRFLEGAPLKRLEVLPTEHFSTRAIAHLELTIGPNGGQAEFEYTLSTLHGDEKPQDQDLKPFMAFVADLDAEAHRKSETQTRLWSSNEIYHLMLNRSMRDIASLTLDYDTGFFPSAGIPWFTAPFGRDALITAYQTLLLTPEIAKGTLRFLAKYQGKEDNPFKDEEPGKIMHEIRTGELARMGLVPHTPYYGSVDATPLFLILLSEYYRWTGDVAFVREIWDAVEGALMWLEGYGDLDGDGFVEYQRRSPVGLVVQGWKDSVNSVIFPDATLAEGAIALAEVQGYVYDAKRRTAELCYLMDLRILGDRLSREASELKEAFNHAFWSEADGFYVEALDGQKRQVNVMTSNPGQALWCGIVAEERIPILVEQLMAPAMFSGWGLRTMSADSPVYNPMSYHNGTIWPHDNSLIIKGMADHGYKGEVIRLMDALFQASLQFPYYRLPELFCGFARMGELDRPVPYPVACSPQAWAAGTIFLMLQAALGIQPDAPGNALRIVQPTLPPWLDEIHVRGLRIRETTLDLQFIQANGVTTARVINKQGKAKILIEG
jgi:glycogen debranching enzyme